MTNIPKLKTKYGEGIGIELFIQFPDISSYEKTYLSGDEALGQTELSVISGKNFSANEYVVIGNPGAETCEIRKIASQTDITITTDALDFAHSRGTIITFIPFNQIVPVRSTDGITYSAIDTVDIRPDSIDTYIQRETDASTDYYKVRFYNETTDKYSQYSDIVTGIGYADNSVHSIKNRALNDLGETVDDDITDSWLNDKLWEARRNVDNTKENGKWSFRFKRNAIIGSIIPGTYEITLPTDLKDPSTNEHILSLRLGEENQPVDYQDIVRFNNNYYGIKHTTLNGDVADTDTSIILTDSGDFDDASNILVASPDISGTIDTVSYTANTLATNTLSGVLLIADDGHSDGADVWQDTNFGLPTAYTIDSENGKIQFDIPFSDDYAGENAYMDYYTSLPVYDSDADTLDEPEYDMYVYWLKWCIKQKRKSGKLEPEKDADFKQWLIGKDNLINNEQLGQYVYLTI